MKKPEKNGIVLLVIAGIFVIAVPFIVLSAFSYGSDKNTEPVIEVQDLNFDYSGGRIFENHDKLASEYLRGGSTQRTLNDYYALRQYSGSPPYISHRVDEEITEVNCLACHEKGGWSEELKLNTPLTPHPEQSSCIQCHVKVQSVPLFVETDWVSTPPPRLGRSHLPGSPVPIPHDLQGRGNCIACHIGPGSVTSIRSDHPERGNCRQCHVPDLPIVTYERDE